MRPRPREPTPIGWMHICLVTSKIFAVRDGVGDYAFRLAVELAREHRVTLLTSTGMGEAGEREGVMILPVIPDWRPHGLRVLIRELRRLEPDVVNLQFEPHLYHRWGVNLWLPMAMLFLRWRGVRLITTVHEPFVPLTIWKWWLSGPIQRVALYLLLWASRKVVVVISVWTRMLQRWFWWRAEDFVRIPVGSNVAPVDLSPEERQALRSRYGLPPTGVVVAVFSPLGSGKQFDLVVRVWEILAKRHTDLWLLLIGVEREEARRRHPGAPTGSRVVYTGFVSGPEVSRLHQCADLALAPYVDGVSARRTSTISMMAHAVPLVGTRGPLTDLDIFEGSPIRLVPVGDEEGFVAAVDGLVASRDLRLALGSRTRLFFERHFAWPVLGKQFFEVAAGACRRH